MTTAPVQVGPPNAGGPRPSLTERELLIIGLISQGCTYRQIGQHIGLAEDSVRPAVKRLLRKLKADSSAHAVHLAHTYGLLSPRPQVDMPEALVQVLELVADGRTNADIARLLRRPENTVAGQVKEARRRLGARDRAHAAALAVDLRIVHVDTAPAQSAAVVDAA